MRQELNALASIDVTVNVSFSPEEVEKINALRASPGSLVDVATEWVKDVIRQAADDAGITAEPALEEDYIERMRKRT